MPAETPPPELVAGCDSPDGIHVLADWVDEHGGNGAEFREQMRDIGERPVDGYGDGFLNGSGGGDGSGRGDGYPYGYGNGDGRSHGHGDLSSGGIGAGDSDGHGSDDGGGGYHYGTGHGSLPNGDGGPDAHLK